MYRELWEKYCQSICSITLLGSTSSKIFGVTGFCVGKNIITDDLIYSVKDASKVKITFYESDGLTVRDSEYFKYEEFLELLPPKRDFDQLGFTIFPAESLMPEPDKGFILCKDCRPSIGMDAATLTYQFEYNNMSIKPAVVTSFHNNNNDFTYLQYDGSVKPGSTGGPLIDVNSGKVIGIIATKELSVVKNYKELMRIIDSNIESLKLVEGKWNVNEIDPIQVLIANQNLIKHISREFFKNSSVRLGIALDVGHLIEHLEGSYDIQPDQFPKDYLS